VHVALEPELEPELVVSVQWPGSVAVSAAVSDLADQVAVVYSGFDSELAFAAEAEDLVVVLAVGLAEVQVKTALDDCRWPRAAVKGPVEVVRLSVVPGFPTGYDYLIGIGHAAWQ
jgi:hypothetical protein